jgi:hypothetical protein
MADDWETKFHGHSSGQGSVTKVFIGSNADPSPRHFPIAGSKPRKKFFSVRKVFSWPEQVIFQQA